MTQRDPAPPPAPSDAEPAPILVDPNPPSRVDAGQGHDAARPTEIPPEGWLPILRRAWTALTDNALWVHCGCVGFFGFLSIFPVLAVFVLIYGLLFDPGDIEGQLGGLRPLVPAAVYDVLLGRLADLAANSTQDLSLGLAVSLTIAMWSGSRGLNAVIDLLNVSYHEPVPRSLVVRALTAVGLTIGALIGLVVVLLTVAAVPLVLARLPLADETARLALWGRWPVLTAFVFGGLMLLYRMAPNRRPAKFRWIAPGAALATVLWIALSIAFSAYVERSEFYGATFGTLSAAAVLMLWIYYSALAIGLGGILNAEIELQTRRDSTRGPDRPRGRRGAVVADRLPRPRDG